MYDNHMRFVVTSTIAALLGAGPILADFSYQQEAKVTGGVLAGVMKFAGVFSKEAREPIVTNIYVKGHRMAHVSRHSAEIVDVDNETITHVDFDHKTYSTITFAQMKQQMEQLAQQMQQQKKDANSPDMQVKVSAKDTGQTKTIDGMPAKEMVVSLEMQGTDPQTGQTGAMEVRSDMWIAPVAGYDQVRNVEKLMAAKLGFVVGGGTPLIQQPDLKKDLGELYKEMAKIDGAPIESVMRMGGVGTGAPDNGTATASNQSGQSGTQQQSTDNSGGRLGRLGSVAGGLGGFGGFGRKKKSE